MVLQKRTWIGILENWAPESLFPFSVSAALRTSLCLSFLIVEAEDMKGLKILQWNSESMGLELPLSTHRTKGVCVEGKG